MTKVDMTPVVPTTMSKMISKSYLGIHEMHFTVPNDLRLQKNLYQSLSYKDYIKYFMGRTKIVTLISDSSIEEFDVPRYSTFLNYKTDEGYNVTFKFKPFFNDGTKRKDENYDVPSRIISFRIKTSPFYPGINFMDEIDRVCELQYLVQDLFKFDDDDKFNYVKPF